MAGLGCFGAIALLVGCADVGGATRILARAAAAAGALASCLEEAAFGSKGVLDVVFSGLTGGRGRSCR